MRITRDELIEELKRIPTNVDIEFSAVVEMQCGECEADILDTEAVFKFDGIKYGSPAMIKICDLR